MDRGQFFVSMELYERALNFKWEVIIVYGPADHSRSASFLDELNRKVSAASLPVVVGGNFNLRRFAEDKSNVLEICPRGNNKWFFLYFLVHPNCLLFML